MKKFTTIAIIASFTTSTVFGAGFDPLFGKYGNVTQTIGPIGTDSNGNWLWYTDDTLISNIFDLHNQGLTQGHTKTEPWSDTYWPDFSGSIAAPYGKKLFTLFPGSWALGKRNIKTFSRRRRKKGVLGMNDRDIDRLSPAEKYDLIMGHEDFRFTKQVLRRVEILNEYERLANWTGVCPGWSLAALNSPRPHKAIQIPSPLGFYVNFYPSDIKALASFAWGLSEVQNQVKLHGNQCLSKRPKRNKDARLSDPKCFDVNPGFMHLFMTHLIGKEKRGFVMDIGYNKRVVNHPAYAYNYHYFNPKTLKETHSIREAMIDLTKERYADPLWKNRAPQTKKIIGVIATLKIKDENRPRQHKIDSAYYDKKKTVEYRYELELDHENKIIGGEWRESRKQRRANFIASAVHQHPDIIWHGPFNTYPFSAAEWDNKKGFIEGVHADERIDWNTNEVIPEQWRNASELATFNEITIPGKGPAPNPQPLWIVIQRLINASL